MTSSEEFEKGVRLEVLRSDCLERLKGAAKWGCWLFHVNGLDESRELLWVEPYECGLISRLLVEPERFEYLTALLDRGRGDRLEVLLPGGILELYGPNTWYPEKKMDCRETREL